MNVFLRFTRRQLLAGSASLIASTALAVKEQPEEPVSFFFISDTHYLAEKDEPAKMDLESAQICGQLIDTLNQLPGSVIPEASGGGKVASPRGVIHGGDCIDSGDKSGQVHEAMQKTEWAAFVADYGLSGSEGKLKYPVFEIHGNHDSPAGKSVAIEGMIQRNKTRPVVDHLSKNGLHYAWTWGHVRFINLGITVGQVSDVKQRRRYNPMASLEFLIDDLKRNVGDHRMPVVITHHVDLARYTTQCNPDDIANLQKEWHPCDVAAYYEAIKSYNIAAILYGHTHARVVFRWDGKSSKAAQGLPVFNVDNSSHFASAAQSIFYFEIDGKEVKVRELMTKDRWLTHQWTPFVWQHAIG